MSDSFDPSSLTDEQKWQLLARHEKLGEILLKMGKITLKQLEQLVEEQGSSEQHLGELIVKKGLMSKQEVMQAVEWQHQCDRVSESAVTELKQRHKD